MRARSAAKTRARASNAFDFNRIGHKPKAVVPAGSTVPTADACTLRPSTRTPSPHRTADGNSFTVTSVTSGSWLRT